MLPQLDTETPEQAVLRYEHSVSQNSSLKRLILKGGPLVSVDGTLHLPKGTIETVSADALTGSPLIKPPSFLLAANEFDQMVKDADKESSPKVIKILNLLGADTYMLPVTPDIGLSEKDSTEFYEKTAASFDANFHLGGDDIDPSLYGKENTKSIDTNLFRDQSELKGLQIKIRSEKGVVYGVCRGHQLCAIAHGHEIIQDIPTVLGEGTADPFIHNKGEGKYELHKIKINHDSFLYFLTGLDEMWVNSYHHQAVLEKLNSSFRTTAKNIEGPSVVEAAQFDNGRGMTFQFHPELADLLKRLGPENLGIMRMLVNYAKYVRANGPPTCYSEALRQALMAH